MISPQKIYLHPQIVLASVELFVSHGSAAAVALHQVTPTNEGMREFIRINLLGQQEPKEDESRFIR